MIEVKPPAEIILDSKSFKIFLGGSIEMGIAEEWQQAFAKAIDKIRPNPKHNVIIFNPRRDGWDNSWKQSIEDKNFAGQVEWELEHLEKSNLVIMYLQPGTKSPISLMELGLFAKEVYALKKQMIVLCPEGFYRKGNVDIVCQFYDIPQAKDMEHLIKMTKKLIKEFDPNDSHKMDAITKKLEKAIKNKKVTKHGNKRK